MAERAGSPTAGRTPAPRAMELPEDPAVVCSHDGEILQVNEAAAALAGFAGQAGELIGTHIGELLQGVAPVLRLRRADGSWRPVRTVRWPVPDSGQQVLLLLDVGDLVAATDALRTEHRRLTEVQQLARTALWEYDSDADTMVWSANFHELLGVRVGAVAPSFEALLHRVHPEDAELVRRTWQAHRSSAEPAELEFRVVLGEGSTRWVQLVAAPEPGPDGAKSTGYLRDVTERCEANQALVTERARLVEAQRLAKIGSWSFEVDTAEVHRSDVFLELYREVGVDPGEDLLCNVHPEDRDELEQVRGRLLHADNEDTVELEVRGEFGGRLYLTRSRAELAASGAVVRLHGTVQDVTEQRMLERQLAEDRRRLSDAQRVAKLGTFEWDPNSDDAVWSDMLCELLGLQPGELASYRRYLAIVHPDDRERVAARWEPLRTSNAQVQCEHRVILADGSERTMRCLGATVLAPDGRRLVVGTAQDITEQRAIQTRMQRTSQRFTDLVAVSPIGIGLFDEDARLLDANDALCDLLDRDLETLRGRSFEECVHPDDRADFAESVLRLQGLANRTTRVSERRITTASGQVVYCEVHIRLSVQDDGARFVLAVFSDVTEKRRSADALRYAATHDELTGLPNRAAVKTLLADLLGDEPTGEREPDERVDVGWPGTEVARPRANIAVLFCDVDNFKRVNDSLGHDAGDELLVALARRLEHGLSPECTAARLSGDEFVIICSDTEAVGGPYELATKVSGLLRNAVPVRGQLVRVSASIGAAVPNRSRVTGADLLRFADAAMFQAKRRGAGRVSLADAELIASAERQVHLEGELREALASDRLRLHYQPVVGADGSVLTAEALVRWPHPQRGLLTPDVFLPVAEQGDLLRDLDRWVLRRALSEAAGWPEPENRKVAVAVNLAALVPGDPAFVDAVADAIAESGIDADRVVLELVETSLVDLPSRSRAAMASLVSDGVRFAVDDFGTGYSSLARLKELPAQIIKIDRQFVSGVGDDPSDFAVARAVVEMARAMGRGCVAEGVETATQFNVLRVVGVDAYQGWLFSRAVPPRELRELLKSGRLHVPRTR